MISGPLPIRLIAAFLGRELRSMTKVIKEDGLPVIPLSSGKRPEIRVYFQPFLDWINQRAENHPMTAEQLEAELDRCQQALAKLDAAKRDRARERQTKKPLKTP